MGYTPNELNTNRMDKKNEASKEQKEELQELNKNLASQLVEEENEEIASRFEKCVPVLNMIFSKTENIDVKLITEMENQLENQRLKLERLQVRVKEYAQLFVTQRNQNDIDEILRKYVDEFKEII